MARVKLELPDEFNFSTEIPLRFSDINAGGHMGHDAVLPLIQEARLQFIRHLGFTETNVAGYGLMMADAAIVYKQQAFYGQVLKIEVGVRDFSKHGCDFVFRVTDNKTGVEIVRAKTGMVFYDMEQGKTVMVPQQFKTLFE